MERVSSDWTRLASTAGSRAKASRCCRKAGSMAGRASNAPLNGRTFLWDWDGWLSKEHRDITAFGPLKIQPTRYFVETLLTTPWIGCGPKCPVAGPVYTRVTFENATSDPPMMQTWSVDAPLDSKVAGPPFPEVVAVPVTTRPETVVGGLLAGQTLVS